MAKLTKTKYPSLEVKTSSGDILISIDGNDKIGGVAPYEINYEIDEGIIDIYDEGGNFTGRIKLPENCLVIIQNNPKTYS